MEYIISWRPPGLLPLGLGLLLLATLGLGLALLIPPASAKTGAGQTLDAFVQPEPANSAAGETAHAVFQTDHASNQARAPNQAAVSNTAAVLQSTAAETLPTGDLAAPAEGESPLHSAHTALIQTAIAGSLEFVYEPQPGAASALSLMVCCVEPTGERRLNETFTIPTPAGPLTAQTNRRGSACLGPLAPGRYTLECSLGSVVFTLASNGALTCTDPLCRSDGEYLTLGIGENGADNAAAVFVSTE